MFTSFSIKLELILCFDNCFTITSIISQTLSRIKALISGFLKSPERSKRKWERTSSDILSLRASSRLSSLPKESKFL